MQRRIFQLVYRIILCSDPVYVDRKPSCDWPIYGGTLQCGCMALRELDRLTVLHAAAKRKLGLDRTPRSTHV